MLTNLTNTEPNRRITNKSKTKPLSIKKITIQSGAHQGSPGATSTDLGIMQKNGNYAQILYLAYYASAFC